jgi:hypothetical protein
MARKKKVLSNDSISDYGIRRKYGLVNDEDIPAVAIAVNKEGFYFEQGMKQNPASKTWGVSFMFPDGPTVEVEGKSGEGLAVKLARALIAEGILT